MESSGKGDIDQMITQIYTYKIWVLEGKKNREFQNRLNGEPYLTLG